MADLASTTTPGVIIPPVPDHLVSECAAALAELEDRFGVAVFDQTVKAHTGTSDYLNRALDAVPGRREQLVADFTRLYGPVPQPERLAQVIPFPARAAGGAA